MRWLLSLTLVIAPAFAQAPAAEEAQPAPAPVLAVLGASLSAGYGTASELTTPKDVSLARFLAAAYPEGALTTLELGDAWFFTNPVQRGQTQMEAVLTNPTPPTAVIAIDFLFWYAYGSGFTNDDARVARLELGLAQLARFECPVLIGDLPDISLALNGKGPFNQPLVTPDMIPREVALRRLNTTIAVWMAQHPNVVQVPLEPMLTRMRLGQELKLRGNTWKPAKPNEALQPDLLHPTVRGSIWVTLATLDAFVRSKLAPSLPTPEFDEQKILARLHADTAEERAAELEKRADREARRARAEARRKEKEREAEKSGAGGR
jgi:hypothetical protein